MPMFGRLFASKELKAALGIIDECELTFFSNGLHGNAFDIIKAELIPFVKKNTSKLKAQIKSGRTPRACVYNLIAQIAESHLISGQYHMYRGVLSSLREGPQLYKICTKAIDILVKEGDVSEEDGEYWKADIRKGISQVG